MKMRIGCDDTDRKITYPHVDNLSGSVQPIRMRVIYLRSTGVVSP